MPSRLQQFFERAERDKAAGAKGGGQLAGEAGVPLEARGAVLAFASLTCGELAEIVRGHDDDDRVFIVGMNQSDDRRLFVLVIGRVAVVLALLLRTPSLPFYFRPKDFSPGLCVAVRDGDFIRAESAMMAAVRDTANDHGVTFLDRDCVLSGMVSVMDADAVVERYEV